MIYYWVEASVSLIAYALASAMAQVADVGSESRRQADKQKLIIHCYRSLSHWAAKRGRSADMGWSYRYSDAHPSTLLAIAKSSGWHLQFGYSKKFQGLFKALNWRCEL